MAGMAAGGLERTHHAIGLSSGCLPCRSAPAAPIGRDNCRELRREDQPRRASRPFGSNAHGRRTAATRIRGPGDVGLREASCDRCGVGSAGSGFLDAGRSRGRSPERRRGTMVVGGRPRRDRAPRSHSCCVHLARRCRSRQGGVRPSLLDACAGPSRSRGSPC